VSNIRHCFLRRNGAPLRSFALATRIAQRRLPGRKVAFVSWGACLCFLLVLLSGCAQTAKEGSGKPAGSPSPSPHTRSRLTIGAAGIPQYQAAHPNYGQIFAELARAGITTFFPYFGYQEVPQPLSYGHEKDFLPPCTPQSPALRALREHHLRLLVPGSLLYAQGYPSLASDPLKALIACAGREQIAGVYSIDEPVNTQQNVSDPYQGARELYQRVKEIDASLPVVMVHAPLSVKDDGKLSTPTPTEIESYLDKVRQFNQYADIIGFDIYPFLPPPYPQTLVTPYQTGPNLEYRAILGDYLRWLREHTDGKPYLLVLQAFSFNWQGASNEPERIPTAQELHTMVCLAYHGGVAQLFWYGQSFQRTPASGLWEKVLQVSKQMHTDAAHTCR
jgi:hypothetical protein